MSDCMGLCHGKEFGFLIQIMMRNLRDFGCDNVQCYRNIRELVKCKIIKEYIKLNRIDPVNLCNPPNTAHTQTQSF